MIPPFVPAIPVQPAPDSSRALHSLLPAGQTRSAIVQQLDSLPGRTDGFRIQVLLESRQLVIEVPRAIDPGTEIRIRRDGNGQVTIDPPPGAAARNAAATDASARTPVDDALRAALPRQQPFGDVFGQLANLRLPATTAGQQVEQLVLALVQLFGLKPGQRDAPERVRRNVEQGGFFSEAGLAAALKDGKAPALDLKARLGQLLQLSEQLPPQAREKLQGLIESLVARVTARQLGSAALARDLPDGGSERHFALDLPVRVGERYENVGLDVRRHRAGADADAGDAEGHWRIRLNFELQEMGALDAELFLDDDNQLSARFWAREADTARRIDARFDALAQALTRQGIRVGTLHCSQGRAPRDTPALQRQLIDLRT